MRYKLFAAMSWIVMMLPLGVQAQEATLADYQKLLINEIMPENLDSGPLNHKCNLVPGMLELFNGSDKELYLFETFLISSRIDWNEGSRQSASFLWRPTSIGAGERVVLFPSELWAEGRLSPGASHKWLPPPIGGSAGGGA